MSLSTGKIFCQIISEAQSSFVLESNLKDNLKRWNELTCFAEVHGLMPLLFSKLSEKKINPPADIKQRLRNNYTLALKKSLMTEKEVKKITSDLNELKIKHILLKGSFLFNHIYPNSCLRDMCDIDILIDPNDFSKIEKDLVGKGYFLETKHYKYSKSILKRHFPKIYINDFTYPIEFHWKLKLEDETDNTNLVWKRSSKTPQKLNNFSYVLSAEDHIIFTCYHKASIDRMVYSLRTLLDLHFSIQRLHIDYKKLLKLLEESNDWSCRKAVFTCMYFARKLLNTPITNAFIEKLKPDDFSDEIEKVIENIILNDSEYEKKSLLIGDIANKKSMTFILSKLLLSKKEIILNYNASQSNCDFIKFNAIRLLSLSSEYFKYVIKLLFRQSVLKEINLTNNIKILDNWLSK